MSPFFESLPKRDRDEILRINGIQCARAPSLEDFAAKSLSDLQKHRRTLLTRTSSSLLSATLHHLQMYICDRGIIRRFIDDNVLELKTGVDTGARLGLLIRTAGGTDYAGYDCAHIFDFIFAMAVADWPAVEVFLKRFPGPFKIGHASTLLLTNSLYAIVRRDRVALAEFEPDLRSRSERHFFRAMYDCLIGIMASDGQLVSDAIGRMVKWNRRQEQLNSSMQKLVCLYAHGLFNLCVKEFTARGTEIPTISDSLPWDADFHKFIHSDETPKSPSVFDFSSVNPVLKRWLDDLPEDLNIDELLAPLKPWWRFW
jgi:hypothetical protein